MKSYIHFIWKKYSEYELVNSSLCLEMCSFYAAMMVKSDHFRIPIPMIAAVS